MIDKTDKKIVKYIMKFINSNPKWEKLFSHHKQIYKIDELFEALIYKLRTGLSYKNISNSIYNINGGTLYYFHNKIIKHNILVEFYDDYMEKYIANMSKNISEFYIDSTLVANKLGIDKATHNIQLKKHKSSKISIIEDDFKIPIDYIISDSNTHDVTLMHTHIQNISNKYPLLCTNNKKFIADSAYDSKNIRNQLKDTKLGILICDKNKRNIKDAEKLEKLKLTLYEKLLLKKRCVIEHANNTLKQNRTVNIRYEKQSTKYENFVLLAIIRIAFKKIGIIENYS